MVKMGFKGRQVFPGKEKCLLDLLLSVLQVPHSVTALTAVSNRGNEVCSVTASC
jgi:hypothetical protein